MSTMGIGCDECKVYQEPSDDAISRQAVIDAIDNYVKSEGLVPLLTYEVTLLFDMIHELPSVKPQEQKWNSVSKKLPEDEEDYLVIDADRNYAVGYYREDCDAWDSSEFGWLERQTDTNNHHAGSGIGKVIAWMHLPEPYEPQESGDME